MGRMGVQPIFPIKVSVTIGTMLNFDSDFDGHGDGDITCKQTLSVLIRTHHARYERDRQMVRVPGRTNSDYWGVVVPPPAGTV